MNPVYEELTPDDREILSDLLFPLFQSAGLKEKTVTRDQIRKELANIFSWPQVAEVLRELEEKDYVQTLSTRGGGIFAVGGNFSLWAEDMRPLDEGGGAAPKTGAEVFGLTLASAEVAALAALFRDLTSPNPAIALAKIQAALDQASEAEIILALARG